MDIRRLSEQELLPAVELARYTFGVCLQGSIMHREMIDGFYRYVSMENLYEPVRTQQIFLWGAWMNGQLVGVSAMQAEGHITMLYVAPFCQRRGIGKVLLKEMRKYAAAVNCNVVTVNAMPIWTSDYFKKQGFRLLPVQQQGAPYASLSASAVKEVTYPVKPMKPGIVAAVIGGFLFLIFLVAFGFMRMNY